MPNLMKFVLDHSAIKLATCGFEMAVIASHDHHYRLAIFSEISFQRAEFFSADTQCEAESCCGISAISVVESFMAELSVIECFETDGGVNYRSDRLIWF